MKTFPLYQQIKNSILTQIQDGTLRAGDRVPSESELAKLFRVSHITSKNALISLVDEGVIYRVQGKGSFVCKDALKINIASTENPISKGNTSPDLIGVIFPYFNTNVEFRLLYNLDKFIFERGFQMLMHNCRESSEEESQTIQNFLELGVKGLIIFPTQDELYNESILRLSLDKFPLALIDRYIKRVNACNVVSDNLQGAYDATSYLINKGHNNIAYISPEITNSTTEDRALGFEKAFQDKKLPINKNLWCIVNLEVIHLNNGYDYILNFLKINPDITSIFTVNIHMLDLTLHALKELNKQVPEDIEIFTFDEPVKDNINYILQDYKAMSKEAVDLLISQIQTSNNTQIQTIIPVELKFRKDTL